MATVCRATREVSDLPSCERGSVEGNVIVEAIGSRVLSRGEGGGEGDAPRQQLSPFVVTCY
jgi:hypothetical protein